MPNKYAHDMYPNDNNYEIQYMKITPKYRHFSRFWDLQPGILVIQKTLLNIFMSYTINCMDLEFENFGGSQLKMVSPGLI